MDSGTSKKILRTDDPDFASKVSNLLQFDLSEEDDSEDSAASVSRHPSLSVQHIPQGVPHLHRTSSPESEDDDFSPTLSELERNSSTEESVSEPDYENDESVQTSTSRTVFTAKNGMKWTSTPPERRGRPLAHNILKIALPGPTRNAMQCLGDSPTELQVWNQFFDANMTSEILRFTNIHLEHTRQRTSASNVNNLYEMSENELKAFIGVLLLTSIYKSNKESTKSLFSSGDKGRPLFRAIMSYRRFTAIKEALRFDDASTRAERKKTDPAAPISGLFSQLVMNSQRLYNVSGHCTIDETLLPFRGRVSFRVYMPNKPAKYGIKLMTLCDARTSYFYNSYIYTGKGSDGRSLTSDEKKLLVPTQALITLTTPIQKSNRNITADNWFSSMEGVTELRKRGLTYVGTMKKNKRELPPQFTSPKGRALKDAMYGFSADGKTTLFSSKVKSTKVVNIISSMHHSVETNHESGLSEINSFYNKTKGGVDALDYKCSLYSTQRKDSRWPMCVFSGMLNMAMVNAFILHKCFANNIFEPRFNFVEKLGQQLAEPHMRDRIQNPHIKQEVKNLTKRVLGIAPQPSQRPSAPSFDDRLEKKKYCSLCSYKNHRQTAYKCVKCANPICLECSRKLCLACLGVDKRRETE